MRAAVVRHYRHTGSGNPATGMILTRYVDCSHREVERADSSHDSYKTAHCRFDSLGEISTGPHTTLFLDASSSPTGGALRVGLISFVIL